MNATVTPLVVEEQTHKKRGLTWHFRSSGDSLVLSSGSLVKKSWQIKIINKQSNPKITTQRRDDEFQCMYFAELYLNAGVWVVRGHISGVDGLVADGFQSRHR